jgi:hypothetical protein
MEPALIGTMLSSGKMLWSLYKNIETKNNGRSPEQLKARLDSLDDVVQQNFELIVKLNAQIEFQNKLIIGAYFVSGISISIATYIGLN